MASKVDEIKSKFKTFVQKQQNRTLKIPSMGGFSDLSNWPGGSGEPAPSSSVLLCSPQKQSTASSSKLNSSTGEQSVESVEDHRVPDQEILESIEDIYFSPVDGAEGPETNVSRYELEKFSIPGDSDSLDNYQVQETMRRLKSQHKVVSKRVMQMILEQRSSCNEEFMRIGETGQLLEESIWLCRKSRSYLNFAKQQLTTSNLEILATYKKRQVLQELLRILGKIKEIKATDERLQTMLVEGKDLPGAIRLLLRCRETTARMNEFHCIASLAQKLQDTQMMTEVQLDKSLNDMCTDFDAKRYAQLQEAYQLLEKSQMAIDQLHINFISQIHSTAFQVVQAVEEDKEKGADINSNSSGDVTKQKPLFEQLCRDVPVEKFIPRLIQLCKSFWKILSCHHQITIWHQNCTPKPNEESTEEDRGNEEERKEKTNPLSTLKEEYVRDKLRSGQARVWGDIQGKVCTYLASPAVHQLKFEQFIQVLSIVMRLKKVGQEFCGDNSQRLLDTIRRQSEEYFHRYHRTCLDEIGLFLDNEAWENIDSFAGFGQLQEFRSVKKAMRRHQKQSYSNGVDEGRSVKSLATLKVTNASGSPKRDNVDNSTSSQDGASSIYVFCGYFLRYSDKSSPFDGGFDETMLQEDILAGIADETSCYFSDDSEEAVDGSPEKKRSGGKGGESVTGGDEILFANNTMLTVLRCVGKYLQMCRLLHVIAPQIVKSLTELIDFYIYVVHELFAKDLPFSSDNIYQPHVLSNLQRVFEEIIPKISHWPPSRVMIDGDLNEAESLFACKKRVVAVEGGVCLVEQMLKLQGYIGSLLSAGEKEWLERYCETTLTFVQDLRKPVYLCIAARFIDIPVVLQAMAKVKWDLNHVTVQYSPYVDGVVNRIVQTFAMRLGELWRSPGEGGGSGLPEQVREQLWDNVAHVVTHVLVEGYASAKNCSTGGRALMQIDFTHILSFMELLSGCKFGSHQVYVDQYVKAYYLPKDGALRDWLQEQVSRNEYSQRQLTGLVMCTCASDKKMRQKLLAICSTDGVGGEKNASPVKVKKAEN